MCVKTLQKPSDCSVALVPQMSRRCVKFTLNFPSYLNSGSEATIISMSEEQKGF